MPYSYKKVGDQYCVYKKDGGEKVGCTDGNKTALKKYLAALHINANENTDSGMFDTIRRHLLQEFDSVYQTTEPIPLSQIAAKKDGANAAVGGGAEDGDQSDDKIAGKRAYLTVSELKPAQTEVIKEKAFAMAIKSLLRGKWDNTDLGAIISNDNYIMDGHHRWAALFLIDPKSKAQGTVIDLPGGPLVTALNVVTVGKLGITTGNKGKGNVADFTGTNMAKVIDDAMINGTRGEYPIKAEDVKTALGKMPNANGNPQLGKEIMMKNADALPKQIMPGAPARVDMPVIDGDKVAMVQKMLEKGLIDLEAPYLAKVQKAFNIKETKMTKKDLKAIKELKFTSAGIPELIQLVYDKKDLLPKLGYRDFKQFLDWVKDWDQEEHTAVVQKIQAMNIPGSQQLIHEIISDLNTKRRIQLEEKLVRMLVRKHLREAEEEMQQEPTSKPAPEPTPEPKKPEPEKVQDEPGLDPELGELTDLYIKKLKNAQAAVDQSDVVEIIGQLLDSFGYGNQDKLTVLQGAKELSVR
jgi:hypothetical protein